MREHLKGIFLLASILLVTGCYPTDIKETAKGMPERIKQRETVVNETLTRFEQLATDSFFKENLELYAELENWLGYRGQASAKIQEAQGHLQKLKALVKEADKKKVMTARTTITRINTALKEALNFSKAPEILATDS